LIRIPTHRAPTHPGEMLPEEFLTPVGLTQHDLAQAIHVPYQRVNEIINGRRGITPGTVLRLAKFFGGSADFWLNAQLQWDLYFAQQAETDELKTIQSYSRLQPAKGLALHEHQIQADRPSRRRSRRPG
jgi:antitoxin HigA-1